MNQNQTNPIKRQQVSLNTSNVQQAVTPATNASSGVPWNKRPERAVPIKKKIVLPKKAIDDSLKYKHLQQSKEVNPWDKEIHAYRVEQANAEERRLVKEKATQRRFSGNPWEEQEEVAEERPVLQESREAKSVIRKDSAEAKYDYQQSADDAGSQPSEFEKKLRGSSQIEKSTSAPVPADDGELEKMKEALARLEEQVNAEKQTRAELQNIYEKSREELNLKINEVNQLKENMLSDQNSLLDEQTEKSSLKTQLENVSRELESAKLKMVDMQTASEVQKPEPESEDAADIPPTPVEAETAAETAVPETEDSETAVVPEMEASSPEPVAEQEKVQETVTEPEVKAESEAVPAPVEPPEAVAAKAEAPKTVVTPAKTETRAKKKAEAKTEEKQEEKGSSKKVQETAKAEPEKKGGLLGRFGIGKKPAPQAKGKTITVKKRSSDEKKAVKSFQIKKRKKK